MKKKQLLPPEADSGAGDGLVCSCFYSLWHLRPMTSVVGCHGNHHASLASLRGVNTKSDPSPSPFVSLV